MAAENKKSVATHSDKVMSELCDTASKAFDESNISELKRCFDRATSEVTELAKCVDSMITVMAMDKGSNPRLIGEKVSDTTICAMKEISLAAIDLAKSVAMSQKAK